MKKSQLKNLIKQIIKESVNQNQPSRSELDTGLMKAVNMEETRNLVGNVKEKVGIDGRYVDDMESGVQVKKMHNLDEEEKQGQNSLETYKQCGVAVGKASKQRDQGRVSHQTDWFNGAVKGESPEYARQAREAFNQGYREGSGYGQKPQYFKENDEEKIPGKFVNRGEIKLDGGLDYKVAEKIANDHWDIFGTYGQNERGVWNFETRGDRWCCSVGTLNGKPAMLSSTTTPGRLNLLVGDELNVNSPIQRVKTNETSASGGAGGYQTPFAFSRKDKDGSKRALDITTKMGFKKVKNISEKLR